MPILGAHMSIAGGYWKAAEAAGNLGMETVQLFTKNNNQWNAKPITADDSRLFREHLEQHGLRHPLSHASYLINLAAPDETLWQKSVDAMAVELERADQLGIPFVVVHPGSFTTSTEVEGIARVSAALDQLATAKASGGQKLRARLLLENTAGQGSNLGWRLEQLAAMVNGTKDPARVGICFDTCHAFAAGYSLATAADYERLWREFETLLGLDRLKAFHLNDSKKELGSRVDRHEHIGHGKLGTEPFRRLLRDDRFSQVPMYLETPKEDAATDNKPSDEPWDVINLRTLRELAER